MLPVETRGKDLADVLTPDDKDESDGVTSSIELADRVGNSVLLRRESAHNDERFEEGDKESLEVDLDGDTAKGPNVDDADEVLL